MFESTQGLQQPEAIKDTLQTERDIASWCEQRAASYRLFSTLFDREITKEMQPFIVNLETLVKEGACQEKKQESVLSEREEPNEDDTLQGEREIAEGFSTMAQYVKSFSVDKENNLACDFARIFLAAGIYEGKAAVPYESIYTSEEGILMQDARDEVRAQYRFAAVMPRENDSLPEDYLSFELEFMAVLNDRIAQAFYDGSTNEIAAYASKQHSFFTYHIANWVPELLDDVNRVAHLPFYKGLAQAMHGFIACEEQDSKALVSACKRFSYT